MLEREEFRLIAEMPFADDGGGVALIFEDFGDGDFVGVDSFLIAGEENPTAFLVFVQSYSLRIGARQ